MKTLIVWTSERVCGLFVRSEANLLLTLRSSFGNCADCIDHKVIEEIDTLSSVLLSLPDYSLYGPATFWQSLGEKHKNLIRQHGFENFKRTINFEYHQWQVLWFGDSKILKLLWRLLKDGKLPTGIRHTVIDSADVANVPNVRSGAYGIFMGLLWQYALTNDRLRCLEICDEPLLGAPIPVTFKGRLVSQDLATSAIELNLIANHLDISKVRRVAEIGSGYGRLAYMTAKVFPQLQYCMFDVPPALVIAQNYLASTLGEDTVEKLHGEAVLSNIGVTSPRRIRAYLPHQLEQFPDHYFDLAINISSFDEMPLEQVDNYFSLIDRKCGGWLYVKGHATAPEWCEVSGGGIAQLPYRPRWKLIYHGHDPFSPSFVERIYHLHPEGVSCIS